MAGAGYKLFATGDVLTAAQVNTYLMQQTVMVFASSTARNTALSGVVSEGMLAYLLDTNDLTLYDGAAWNSFGAGDITGVTAGTGLSGGGTSGAVTVSIDTAVTADLSTAQTLTNKTLTAPIVNLATSAQTASYTLVLTDNSDIVEISNASANNLTVPLNSSVPFPIGSQINILQTGAGQTTIVATGGVTINSTPGLKLRAQWSAATLIKRGTDTWVAVGDLSA
jgi:hypothetical protein